MGRCITPTMTTETLLRTTTTEVAQTTKPPMTTIVGIAVPGSLLLLILLIAIGVGIYNGIRSSKNTSDYRILVIIPDVSLPRLGNELDERGRLILYTTPRCTVARLAEKIHTALTNVGEPSQMRLQVVQGDGRQTPLLSKVLSHDHTMQHLNLQSETVVQITSSIEEY